MEYEFHLMRMNKWVFLTLEEHVKKFKCKSITLKLFLY